jgi:hypothetical protein
LRILHRPSARRKCTPILERLDLRIAPAPTPLVPPPPPIDVEAEIDQLRENLDATQGDKIRQQQTIELLREMWIRDRSKQKPTGQPIPDFPPPPATGPIKSWLDQWWDEMTEVLKSSYDSGIPLFHP